MRLCLLLPLLIACPGEPEDTDLVVPVGPLQTFTPDAVAFGSVPVGDEASPEQVTIGNPGDEPLDVYTIEVADPDLGLSIGSVGDGQRIRAGFEGTFIVKLRPSEPGPLVSEVRITSNVTPADAPAVVPITAEVVSAELAAEPTAVVVELPSEAASLPVVLRNPGAATVSITDATVSGSPAFGVDLDVGRNGALPWELEPVDPDTGRPSRTLFVTWDPDQAVGADAGELVITSTSWSSPTLRVALSVR